MTSLTLNGSAAAATTLAAAGKLFSTTGGTSGNTSTKVGSGTLFKQIFALGTTTSQTGVSSIPAPTDSNWHGWMWDVTTLEGQSIAAGTWTPTIHLLASTSTTVTPTVQWFKRSSSGVYTQLGSVAGSSIALTTASQALTFTAPSLAQADFAVGDKLCMWLWVNQTAGGATNSTISVVEATSTSTAGVVSEAQTVTPGYASTPGPLSVTLAGAGTLTGAFSIWFNTAYQFKKQIVIDHTKVSGGSDLSNFPVLISRTDADLKSSANGGNVQSSSGFDIIFTDSTQGTKLDHEIEQYVATTGEIEMWVRIPTLSATTDTIIYIYYDNSSISTSQENKTGVWDSNYKGVWHLSESGTGTAGEFKDSTSNANHGQGGTSATCPDQAAGQIGKGQSFVRANLDTIVIPNNASLNFTTTLTLSAWFKSNSTNTGTGNPVYLSKGNWEYSIGNTGAIELDTWENNATNVTGGTLSTSWVYVVWTLDSVGNHSIGYVNGGQVFSAAAVAVTTSANTITMGHVSGFATTPNTLDGILDEVRASNAVRSAGWITTEYNNQSAPATFYSVGSQLSQPITLGVTLAGVGTFVGTLSLGGASLTGQYGGVGTLVAAYTYGQTAALYGYAYYAPTFYLSYATSLTATVAGVGALSGTLSTSGGGGVSLATTLAGVGVLSGTLSTSTSLSISFPGAGSLSGTLATSTSLATNLAGVGVLTGTISAAAALSGSLSGLGALSGTLSTTSNANLTANLAGIGVLSGTPSTKTSLSAGLAGVGTLSGALGARTSLSISLPGVGTLNGTLSSTTTANLSAIFAAVGTFSGTASFSTALTSSFPGVGVLSGTSSLSTVITGALSGAGALSVLLQARVTFSASFPGLGALTATPSLSTALFASLPGVGALSGLSTFRTLLSALLPGSGSITGLLQGGVTLLIRSIAHDIVQVLSTAWKVLSALSLSSVQATALTITHQGIPMPAPNTTILSTITVTDTSGALVSNANSVSLVIYFPDSTTSSLALNSGILNLGSGQYQAKYNTKQPGEIRELWSIVGADGTTLASAQFLIGVEY